MVSPSKLSHVVFQSNDPYQLADWYATLLDARINFKSAFITTITYDEEHHRMAFMGMPPGTVEVSSRREPNKVGFAHFAFGYESPERLLGAYERAKERNIEPVICLHHGPTISLYYKDPDANNVELLVDCMTSQEACAYLESPAFEKNFVGQPFDPAAALARLKAGASNEEIMFFDPDVNVDVLALGMEATAKMA